MALAGPAGARLCWPRAREDIRELTVAGTAVAAVIYAMAAYVAVHGFVRAAPSPVRRIVGLTILGFVAHTTALAARAAEIGRCPSATPFECVLLTAWILVTLYLVLGAAFRIGYLGAFVLPLAAFLCVAALFMGKAPLGDLAIQASPWLGWHASFALLGYASFALGFALGAMYWVQQRQIRRGRPGLAFLQFPSLPRLDHAQVLANAVGWAAFTVGIAAGFLWNRDLYGVWFSADPKFVWSLAVWACYGTLVALALGRFGRDRRLVGVTLLVFAAMTLTFPLSNALSRLHRF